VLTNSDFILEPESPADGLERQMSKAERNILFASSRTKLEALLSGTPSEMSEAPVMEDVPDDANAMDKTATSGSGALSPGGEDTMTEVQRQHKEKMERKQKLLDDKQEQLLRQQQALLLVQQEFEMHAAEMVKKQTEEANTKEEPAFATLSTSRVSSADNHEQQNMDPNVNAIPTPVTMGSTPSLPQGTQAKSNLNTSIRNTATEAKLPTIRPPSVLTQAPLEDRSRPMNGYNGTMPSATSLQRESSASRQRSMSRGVRLSARLTGRLYSAPLSRAKDEAPAVVVPQNVEYISRKEQQKHQQHNPGPVGGNLSSGTSNLTPDNLQKQDSRSFSQKIERVKQKLLRGSSNTAEHKPIY